MKKVSLYLTVVLITALTISGFGQNIKNVKIGNQVWMTENLNVDKFRTGEAIPEAKTADEWKKASENEKPAWCYSENNPANGIKYGKLYNWYAVNDPRGLAPKGWHVPTEEEFFKLENFLEIDGTSKITNTIGWSKDHNGTNSTGFSGLPGGLCNKDGQFIWLGETGYWWSSNEKNADFVRSIGLYGSKYRLSKDLSLKGTGFSIRCIMGEEIKTPKNNLLAKTNEPNGNFKKVIIGDQVWMTENLNLEKFRNGDSIPHAKKAAEWELASQNKQPAWCYYDNKLENGTKYGKLYNWYAVNDPRGLAPKDWHIPSDEEWTKLSDYLGGKGVSGVKLKSKSGFYNKRNATNQSGFSGLPGGARSVNGGFADEGEFGFWWSTTEGQAYNNNTDVREIWCWSLSGYYEFSFKNLKKLGEGYSVRCIMD